MLLDDKFDIGYRFLDMFLSLGMILILGSGIIGYFFTKKRKQKNIKYQMIGYLLISMTAFIDSLTYFIPSTTVYFVTYKNFCNALGVIQNFVENIVSFFTIGMSINLLCVAYPRYRECRCRKRRSSGEIILYSWAITGLIYCSFYLLFEIFAKLMGPRGNRCWMVYQFKDLSPGDFQWIASRGISVLSAVVAVICAVLFGIKSKNTKKELKRFYLSHSFEDVSGYETASGNISSLDRSLLKKFLVFLLFMVVQTIISPIWDSAEREGTINNENSMYFGWIEGLYIISGSIVGLTFGIGFIQNFVMKLSEIKTKKKKVSCENQLNNAIIIG